MLVRLVALVGWMTALGGASPVESSEPVPDRSGYIETGGNKMYYELFGHGDPLLLVHGYGLSGREFYDLIPELSKHYFVIVPDLRGCGRSTNSSLYFDLAQVAGDLVVLLDKLHVKSTRAIGVSGGADVLLHLAYEHGERLSDAVLIGAVAYFSSSARALIGKITPESLSKDEREELRKYNPGGDPQIDRLQSFWHKYYVNDYKNMNFTPPQLNTIKARVLLINGDDDPCYSLEEIVALAKNIPGAHLWVVPNGGHMPLIDPLPDKRGYPDSDPAHFLGPVLGFLARSW